LQCPDRREPGIAIEYIEVIAACHVFSAGSKIVFMFDVTGMRQICGLVFPLPACFEIRKLLLSVYLFIFVEAQEE